MLLCDVIEVALWCNWTVYHKTDTLVRSLHLYLLCLSTSVYCCAHTLIAVQGRTCTMKRAIIPEQQVPSSLAALLQHSQQQLPPQALTISIGSCGSRAEHGYSGPVSSLQTGDYVAVLVRQLGGTSTLLSQPLARTSIREFAQVLGTSTPGLQQIPAWMKPLTAIDLL